MIHDTASKTDDFCVKDLSNSLAITCNLCLEFTHFALQSHRIHFNQYFLKGKHLLYMKTTTYVRNKWHFWLCSNHQFHYRSQGGAVDVGAGFAAASQGANSGQWQVEQEQTLVLRYGNGDVEQYDLSYTNDTLYLNGRRYFVVDNDVCD